MSTTPSFQDSTFGPREIAVLQAAYKQVMDSLDIGQISEPIAEAVAAKILAAVRASGVEMDAEGIAAHVIKGLRLPVRSREASGRNLADLPALQLPGAAE